LAALGIATLLAAALPVAAAAAPAPAWSSPALFAEPTNLAPAGSPYASVDGYFFSLDNIGAAPTQGTVTLTLSLPAGLTPTSTSEVNSGDLHHQHPAACSLGSPGPGEVTCTFGAPIGPGDFILGTVKVDPGATPEGTQLEGAGLTVSGGGALPAIAQSPPTAISSADPPFALLGGANGLALNLTDRDGLPATAAGTRPGQLAVNVGFPLRTASPTGVAETTLAEGGARDLRTNLPPGLIVDPAATPLRCTEAELESDGCPNASAIGEANIYSTIGSGYGEDNKPLYNMVPPPGAASSFAFNAVGVGIFPHILGGLRPGDYTLSASSQAVLGLYSHPFQGIRVKLWGNASEPAFEPWRGACLQHALPECPVPPQTTPLLTMPTQCRAASTIEAEVDSWGHPGAFTSYSSPLTDSAGEPTEVDGCNAEPFEPTISATPTTSLADSPTGLQVDLHIPQHDICDSATVPQSCPTATAHLKDARVTLPAGLVANPSQATGLEACSTEEVGIDAETGIANGAQPACPDAAKLGTVEVTSPLLAQYKEEGGESGGIEVETDPETGEPIPRPLQGSVYLAQPFHNPFNTLLAIYLVIDDAQSGILVKLAGEVSPDPQTGQLTATFKDNPQLPFDDFKLSFFGGARASLTTPLTCGTHATTTDLTPWSTPEGADAHPQSSFQTTAEPGGGACPTNEGGASNAPAFSAGTLSPQAGAYSPFVLKLSRNDGSQRLVGIDTTLPPGLIGKLAGIAECSDAQIAGAKAREHPNEGIAERESPFCPASSEVGTVDVAAGAGPTPFHTSGHAYLAGPYKGAPLSLAVIVPAVAGPFDLGAVVSRVALYVNPDTAQIHAVSDPLPQILDGIPLDVRSIALTMGRPEFTLNPTSCEPFSITGSATSALGQSAALSNPFQVGGCPQLPFKPKLSLKLKGGTRRTGHPKLIADLKAKPGEANVAQAQVKLPPSAFLDQAHIRTVCTRVQFAANACPQGSIYGTATAVTPLLSDPLSGNVYLRSSSHKLPDLVVALKGPPSLPIEIDLDGKTDSVKGALRNSFEAVPDAPVSSFRLELFGGKKGLVVNSRNLCAHAYKAKVDLTGQNGKVFDTEPVVGTDCKGHKKRWHKHR